MIEPANIQWLDHLRQCNIVALHTPRPHHIQRHRQFQIVEHDSAVPSAGPAIEID